MARWISEVPWDARFGPVGLVGLDGVFTEVLRDVIVALAPVEDETARGLLAEETAACRARGLRGQRRAAAAFAG